MSGRCWCDGGGKVPFDDVSLRPIRGSSPPAIVVIFISVAISVFVSEVSTIIPKLPTPLLIAYVLLELIIGVEEVSSPMMR